jgi:hypothetical protein
MRLEGKMHQIPHGEYEYETLVIQPENEPTSRLRTVLRREVRFDCGRNGFI